MVHLTAQAASTVISQDTAESNAPLHTPTPWIFRDVGGAGLEIYGPVYQVTGVELPQGMPSAPIMTFKLAGPQNVLVAAERWVQFEPKGWHEMQAANAAFIVKAVNSHEALIKSLADAINELEHSGYAFDHPSLVEKRAVLAQSQAA